MPGAEDWFSTPRHSVKRDASRGRAWRTWPSIFFDAGGHLDYWSAMTQDVRQTLERIISFCNAKWTEAHEAADGAVPPPETLTAEKHAYNEVYQFVRTLLDEQP